jgi:hypothetical protein
LFFSLNSYSMEKLFPKSFSPSVHQFLRVHYNFFIPSVMIGVLHATVIEVPHLHKTAYSSYRNAKTGMTSKRTKLPEIMHTVLPQSVYIYLPLCTALLRSTNTTKLLTLALYNNSLQPSVNWHCWSGGGAWLITYMWAWWPCSTLTRPNHYTNISHYITPELFIMLLLKNMCFLLAGPPPPSSPSL